MKKEAKLRKKSQSAKTAKSAPEQKAQGTEKAVLIGELKALLKDIDEEGLKFLIQQAGVILHNLQVAKINEEIKKLKAMEKMDRKAHRPDKSTVAVEEAEDGSHFILTVNKARKFLVREEMRKIVRICHACDDEKDAAGRLFRWFSQNRKDILVDGGLKGRKDPVLRAVYSAIISEYKVKKA